MKLLNCSKTRLMLIVFMAGMLCSILGISPCMSQTNSEDIAAQIDAYLNDKVSQGQFSGSVLVAKEGQAIISKGYGMANYEHDVLNQPYTKFRLQSLAKQFTAMAIMILQEAGMLSVDDSICTYITDCPGAWEQITIHNLLTHTSGLRDYTSMDGAGDLARLPKTLDMTIDLIRDKSVKFTPGTRFNYCNSNYVLLTAIIESASGKSYADFMEENIFEPLGMINSGVDNSRTILKNRAAGYARQSGNLVNANYELVDAPCGDGHIYTTVEDMVLWDQALYTDQLVSQDTLDAIFTPWESDSYTGGYYGYGWEIVERGDHEVLQHGGLWWGFATFFARVPEQKICVVVLSNFQHLNWDLVDDIFDMAMNIPETNENGE